MDINWAEVLGLGATVASGGVFGLLGSAVGAVFKFFQARQAHSFEKDRWEHEDKLLQMQMEARQIEQEHELAVVAQAGSWKAMEITHRSDMAARNISPWAANIKALYRPFLTTLLVGLTGWLFWELKSLLEGNTDASVGIVFAPAEAKTMMQYIVYSMTFSAATAVTWWFGDRAFAPPALKNR